MNTQQLQKTAQQLLAPGKGILAADESVGTANKRLATRNIPQTEDARRTWRELLFTSPTIEQGLSGIILFDETIRQSASSGTPFRDVLLKRGIIAGIKVDKGLVDLPGFPDEKITEGLDGLGARLAEYAALGARFTKWRAVVKIGNGIPTEECLEANAFLLAEYAARSEETGLVPIIEPEVLIDGAHTLAQSEAVLTRTLQTTFAILKKYRVYLPGVILKTSMALSGKESGVKAAPADVAAATLRALTASVPKEIPGIVFLSGGQTPQEATANLNEMAKRGPHPWQLTFSYARALQDPAMDAWAGQEANVGKAQEAFAARVRETALAREGKL
jgi:fructose-bisphosphate aldolase class I